MHKTARVPVPSAEEEDGEQDKTNKPLNRKIHISAPAAEQEGKSTVKQKKYSPGIESRA